ncbi:RNase adapter RapZ [Neisseria leonii]|uniref:RNase adapter RapZ n=1 Tax=Neisseria leonii TaxID=2995413 RepID=UPI00237AC20B|nr:RNase adapter RapZ [Neisseria sp. 3986]MDD9325360.1 RNase adapter RapZ [Neisseria sp. 3986]
MKIILISGLSGSGKSVALGLLEDTGYYCVDNLPLELLPDLVRHHIAGGGGQNLAVSVDIRSRPNIGRLRVQSRLLRQGGHRVELLFLEAAEEVLLRRFSETRRSHPLAAENGLSLQESLVRERKWLWPLREWAYCIDTSKMNAQQLRYTVQQWLDSGRNGLMVVLESFGFKYGVPSNIDFLFDMRSLPNPYYDTALRPFNGLDEPVRQYLAARPEADEMIGDIEQFMLRRLAQSAVESRSYVTIGIGCTGGQHRSVYVAEALAERLRRHYQVLVRHRQLVPLPREAG